MKIKKILSTLLFVCSIYSVSAQNEDYYGPVTISFHGFICNRPTNDDGLGMDGVGDEVSVHFWNWVTVANNRANFNGLLRIYGEDFFLHDRVKAGTATINGGIKAGDSYYREGVYGDNEPNTLSKYAIITTFCSQTTLIAILPTIFERDEGTLGVTPIQDFGVATNNAFNDMSIKQKIWDFRDHYTYNDADPYGYFLAGRYIGLDAKYAGMFTANKTKLATRPIGLFPNWDFSSQILVLTPKTIKIIAEKDYGYGKGIIPVLYNEESLGNTFGHGNYILLLRVVADIKDRNANNQGPATRSIGVKVNAAGSGEEFKFQLRSGVKIDSITIKNPDTLAYFPTKIAVGQQYYVTQKSGPRTCQLSPLVGLVADRDILVTANCSLPPSQQKIGVKVNAVGADERFEFSAGANKKITITEANKVVYFPGTFTTGYSYTVTQLYGPRTCQLTSQVGQIRHEDVVIDASCGTVPKRTKLYGKFTAPPGTKIILQLENSGIIDTLTLSVTNKAPGHASETIDFTFPRPYRIGTPYKITIKSSPAELGSIIYANGSGSIEPASATNLVGIRCDQSHDLVSRSTDNKILNTYYESSTPAIGGIGEDEGRYVAFVTTGKGMDGSTGNNRQIFLRDRKNGTTKLISKTAGGEEGNKSSFAPTISADGKSIAFESYATNLAADDNNATRDIFLWQESSGNVTLISKSQAGGSANSESMEPAISGNGSVIVYCSNAADLSPNANGGVNVFIYNLNSGSTELISKDYETGKGVSGSAPSISEDGTKIAFCSYSYRLTKNDTNNLWDIFLWERSSTVLKRISFTSTGAERNQGTESSSQVVAPSISGDGNFVVYATTASNMVTGDSNQMQDVFICNTSGGDVRRMSKADETNSNGNSPISQGDKIGISFDGSWITYNTNADNLGVMSGNIVLQNTQTGKLIPVTNTKNGSTTRPVISRTGSYVVAGCSEKYDKRFPSSGIFIFYTSAY